MSYKRTIKFHYYQLKCKHYDRQSKKWGEPELFDFVNWLDIIDDHKLLTQTICIDNFLCSIDKINYDQSSGLWVLRLMKLRDIPSKVKENQAAEAIKLEDDEYIGEDVYMVYDRDSGILMLQSNRFSLNYLKVEQLIEYINNDKYTNIYLVPILNHFSNENNSKRYRSLEISFANLSTWDDRGDNKKSLASIINPIRNMGGVVGRITISLGHVKTDSLRKSEVNALVTDIQKNKRYINIARLKVKDDDEPGMDIIDLFDNAFHDFIEFTLQNRQTLDFERAVGAIIGSFQKRKTELYKAIGYKME